jgi:putative oxidoreductase
MPGIPLLAARILLAVMFLASGYAVLADPAGAAAYFEGLGLPSPRLAGWAVMVLELGGGAMLVAGLLARPVALLLSLFSIAASILGHYGQGGGDAALAFLHTQALLKDIAVAGGLIALAVAGAGPLSLDRLLFRR